MAYNIEYDDKAIKQLKKIDKSQRDIILKWIKKNLNNSENPRETGKKLKDYWRYRVGKYRIITEINDEHITIIVINIGHKSDGYKNK
ncbi:MAG TPA: type II toxin-antitoxin system mRNA interferase toxin, RelE/StbE family [Jeotgalicoccus sp.]|nr:type II toxin-antitoxin system mRNA interferase toxin, RelE/StbE family [Jeotgalicoccus sp.]